ncbi:protein prune homolog 2-like isoform X1 [Argiope bruennichi]|uniref:Protein prune like protein n=2 Tax=Argiope bruennichi TaxID=94029 RepID=A0A8T0FKC0_ARGBR|nr:protein prune homolog 2-like isoform X1 [Argiope bruennichi]KAF8790892.1 Protein prune like protein [Argiope bruennichi]
MPSFDDDLLQLEFIVPKRTEKSMTEDLTPSVVLKNNRLTKPKDCDADVVSGKASPDSCETSKDCGTEKEETLEQAQFSDPLQSGSRDTDSDPEDDARDNGVYFAETVDFPDSPLHLKLLKKRSREAQGLDTEDDDEEESTTFSIMGKGHHHPHRSRRERPKTLMSSNAKGSDSRRKITVNPDVLSSDVLKDDDQRSIDSLSNKSDVLSPLDDLATPDDIDTPDDLDDDLFDTTEEIRDSGSHWKACVVGGEERRIDMKVIEPYKKVLSHGGYIGSSNLAIIVFSACYLPDRSRLDYDYVMDNLFLYVLTTLSQLVAEDYVLVYLHGATSRSCMPSFGWLKRCYQMIDRRLRKNLKGLYLVHPTFWLKTIVIMTKPFISSKFSRKLRFVNSLQELEELIPMDHVCIPDKVKEFDETRIIVA